MLGEADLTSAISAREHDSSLPANRPFSVERGLLPQNLAGFFGLRWLGRKSTRGI